MPRPLEKAVLFDAAMLVAIVAAGVAIAVGLHRLVSNAPAVAGP